MEERYKQYIAEVAEGRTDWAISPNTAEGLVRLCEREKPKTILDLGSGFTSYVLGCWARDNGAEVWTVDDKQEWLRKTEGWLQGNDGCGKVHHFMTWHEFWEKDGVAKAGPFDLVMHDMGHMNNRIRVLRPVMTMVKPGGWLVLHDMHFANYHSAAKWLLGHWGFTAENLEDDIDEHRRFSWACKAPMEWPKHKRQVKVLMGIPHERTMLEDGFDRMWDIATLGWPKIPGVYNRTDIQRNNFALYLLYCPVFTHMLMLDMDHVHPSRDDIVKLCRNALDDPNKLVIAGLYYRRGPPYDALAWMKHDDKIYAPMGWKEGMEKVVMAGTGIMLVAREAFERMPIPWFKYTYDQAEEMHFPSEDTYFCNQCVSYGIDIWADPAIKSGHIKTEVVDDAYSQRYYNENKDVPGAFDLFPPLQIVNLDGSMKE